MKEKQNGKGPGYPRRGFIKTALAAGAGVSAGAFSRRARGDDSVSSRPNIVIIMADDMGYGDLGCYGCESISTPNLDGLAEDGVRLTSFYSSAAVCSPSRGGLLTGRYPSRIGIRGVYFPIRNPATPFIHAVNMVGPGMNVNELTLAELVGEAGYKTCCIGKWHLGDMKRYRPNHRGFDHFMGLHYSNDMTPLPLYRNDEIIEKSPVDQNYLTRKYTEEAIAWIDENHDRPFLLYMPHTFPHIPLHASPEFRGRSRGGPYGDCVEELDWSVGEVLDRLDQHGISDNTFVFFTSDNGPWYEGRTAGIRGRKGSFFDGGQRVPGIARLPGIIPPGSVSGQMAMNIDLFTTSLSLAGLEPPGDRPIDGKNILPMLAGKSDTPHEELYFHGGLGADKIVGIRTPRWKYHKRHSCWTANYSVMKKGPMLFDMEIDPSESFDVRKLYPDVAEDLGNRLKNWTKTLEKGVPRRR